MTPSQINNPVNSIASFASALFSLCFFRIRKGERVGRSTETRYHGSAGASVISTNISTRAGGCLSKSYKIELMFEDPPCPLIPARRRKAINSFSFRKSFCPFLSSKAANYTFCFDFRKNQSEDKLSFAFASFSYHIYDAHG